MPGSPFLITSFLTRFRRYPFSPSISPLESGSDVDLSVSDVSELEDEESESDEEDVGGRMTTPRTSPKSPMKSSSSLEPFRLDPPLGGPLASSSFRYLAVRVFFFPFP